MRVAAIDQNSNDGTKDECALRLTTFSPVQSTTSIDANKSVQKL
jgi:hypothetical protein